MRTMLKIVRRLATQIAKDARSAARGKVSRVRNMAYAGAILPGVVMYSVRVSVYADIHRRHVKWDAICQNIRLVSAGCISINEQFMSRLINSRLACVALRVPDFNWSSLASLSCVAWHSIQLPSLLHTLRRHHVACVCPSLRTKLTQWGTQSLVKKQTH
jgi:hypothetical protein